MSVDPYEVAEVVYDCVVGDIIVSPRHVEDIPQTRLTMSAVTFHADSVLGFRTLEHQNESDDFKAAVLLEEHHVLCRMRALAASLNWQSSALNTLTPRLLKKLIVVM